MQTIAFKTRRAAENDSERPEVPENFTCIDPAQKPMVLRFLVKRDPNLKEQAMVHLRLCLHCRDIAAKYLDQLPKESSESVYTSRVDLGVASNKVS